MENQHKMIKGYRDLSQQEIDLMNEIKAMAEQVGMLVKKVDDVILSTISYSLRRKAFRGY